MQLKANKNRNVRARLSVATCSLLQVAAPAVQAAGSEWDIDTAFLYYGESDGRVSAFEPAIFAGKELNDEGKRIDLRLVVDSLTGATPNGAHASSVAQTFTTPSGNKSYTIQPGETPVDDTFRDTREAVGVDWTLPVDRMSRFKLGLNASSEFDYLSLGMSGSYIRDFNNKNTTLTASLAFNNDTYSPEGGIPIALSPMRQPGERNREGGEDTKTLTDFMIGVTQVVSRKTLMELNYSYGMSDGYLNDPFKIVTVVDPVTGLPDNSGLLNVNADALPYVYENRPDSRQRNTLFYRVAHHLTEDVVHFSYRYFWDDWGISSNTFDLKYRYQLGERSYLQPQVRYYMQDAADFYRHNLVQGEDVDANGAVLLDEVSSDSRLSKFTTTTLGLKYGHTVGKNSEFTIRGGFMTQSFDDGNVTAGEETPDLDAIILNIGYSFHW